MGLRTELSFRHGSCVRKNRADPCAALRLRAGESAQGRRYVSGTPAGSVRLGLLYRFGFLSALAAYEEGSVQDFRVLDSGF